VNQIPLTELPPGRRARVTALHGGMGFVRRLYSLGIRPGARVTKTGAVFSRGPVTVRVGGAEIALGYGMAQRVLVVPEVE